MDHCLSSERRALVNEKQRDDVDVDEMAADFLEKRSVASLCLSRETALEREAVAAMEGLIAASACVRRLLLQLLVTHKTINESNEWLLN